MNHTARHSSVVAHGDVQHGDVHDGDELCVTCRLADGRPHVHTRDHLHAGPVACACADHDSDASAVDFGLIDGREAEAFGGRSVRVLPVRGPPQLIAA